MMGQLPRNVREFIMRDLIYIVGGGIVLASFLYRFDRLPQGDTPVAFYLLGAGVAYVLGYSLQDIFSIARFVTTGPVVEPGSFIRWVYCRFTGEKWKQLKEFDPSEARQALRSLVKNDEARAAGYERAIGGMILASTMAPCTLVASLLILWKWRGSSSGFDLAVGVTSLTLSVGLFILARLKAAQVTQIDAEALADYRATAKKGDVSSEG